MAAFLLLVLFNIGLGAAIIIAETQNGKEKEEIPEALTQISDELFITSTAP